MVGWASHGGGEQAAECAGGQEPVGAGEVAAEDVAADGEADQRRETQILGAGEDGEQGDEAGGGGDDHERQAEVGRGIEGGDEEDDVQGSGGEQEDGPAVAEGEAGTGGADDGDQHEQGVQPGDTGAEAAAGEDDELALLPTVGGGAAHGQRERG
ncbi:hypothetical protein [Kutzneria sp. CA-103260]|uniref:hypothetical protein n=1 Tax=Kutzneria sp. CA-103260 TaxID=2802641 RepID=UPI001BA6D027|nr:hypothetical protein [Kutzneria sp. CA-103260]